jgi:hypothetical protein
MNKFDTHKFLFTLNHEGNISGHRVLFLDRDNNEIEIELERIEIGASPVSCKMFDKDGKKYLVPFIRVRKIFLGDTLVWDNTDTDLSNVKIIKGY